MGKLSLLLPHHLLVTCNDSTVSSLPLQLLEFKPVPLEPSHGDDYMLALKQEIRGTMRRLPCYLKANAAKSGEPIKPVDYLIQSHGNIPLEPHTLNKLQFMLM